MWPFDLFMSKEKKEEKRQAKQREKDAKESEKRKASIAKQAEQERYNEAKKLDAAIDFYDEATTISSIKKQMEVEKQAIADLQLKSSRVGDQLKELISNGKRDGASEADKTQWGHTYDRLKTQLKGIEVNSSDSNKQLLYLESILWSRERKESLDKGLFGKLRQLTPDEHIAAVEQLKKDSTGGELPIDHVVPTSSEVVESKSSNFDEYMELINESEEA